MSVEAKDFIASAREFLARFQESPAEISLRNSMSRAYYAAFTKARQILPSLSNNPLHDTSIKGGIHVDLQRHYRGGGTSMTAVADMLATAHRMRCLADYDVGNTIVPILATKQIAKCEGIIRRLEQLESAALR